MKFIRKNLNTIMFVLLIGATIFCLFETVILANTPEIVPWGSEFGDFLATIAYSYIVAAIFYFVALKIERDKQKKFTYFAIENVKRIETFVKSIFDEFSRHQKFPSYTSEEILMALNPSLRVDKEAVERKSLPYSTLEEMSEMLKHIDPNAKSKMQKTLSLYNESGHLKLIKK